MDITYQGKKLEVAQGCTVREALKLACADTRGILAGYMFRRVLEMDDVLPAPGELEAITLADEEGRRIYERSLRFIMLLAVRRAYPSQRVRLEYSIGHGVFVRLPGMQVGKAELDAIREQMNLIVADDLPFTKRTWSLPEATAYFEREGQADKVKLLRYRKAAYFNMYCCGDMWEYFYGAMAASTGAVKVFDLMPYSGGFVLQMPAAHSPDVPAPYVDRPKHLSVFRQSSEWCSILGVLNAADLAEMTEQKQLRFFIRVNEALHEQAIGAIARDVVRLGRRIVLIAGPSSSGKTTFAGRLAVQLRVLGHKSHLISLDDYYLDRDAIAPEPDGSIDLEAITTLDLPLLQEHVRRLMAGEEVEIPRFSFTTGKRCERGRPLKLHDGELVIIEGIHGLNPMLSQGMPEQAIHRIFVSALTCINLDDHNRIRTTDVRLLRRIVRDHQFRGTPPEQTLAMWPSVRRGEEIWIFPYQEQADSMFNTALHYELPILRHFAYPRLCAVTPDDPGYLMASRLRKILNYIPNPGEEVLSEIPPLSLLREFIGGCTIDAQ